MFTENVPMVNKFSISAILKKFQSFKISQNVSKYQAAVVSPELLIRLDRQSFVELSKVDRVVTKCRTGAPRPTAYIMRGNEN